MEAYDVLESCGNQKPIAKLTHTDVPFVIVCVALHTTVFQRNAELDQIVKGLKDAGVLDMIRTCPDLFRRLFVKSTTTLSAGTGIAVNFSNQFGSNLTLFIINR